MCGIVGIVGTDDIFTKLHLAGRMLQHRGSDGTGVALSDGACFLSPYPYRTLGKVTECYDEWQGNREEEARLGVLHIRYGTSGNRQTLANVQPFTAESPQHGPFCLVHNGDTIDADTLRDDLARRHGVRFQSTSDSEALAALIALCSAPTLHEAVAAALQDVKSAYALVIATPRTLIATRDRYGYRPLSVGVFPNGGYVVASETCAFDIIGARFLRDVMPGEAIIIDKNGIRTAAYGDAERGAACAFEFVYFAYPLSRVFGRHVGTIRESLGKMLAEEYCAAHGGIPDDAVIVAVPDSANHYGYGFARAVGRQLTLAILRTHDSKADRSFTTAEKEARDLKVRLKFRIDGEYIAGKHVFLVDDSLVRGTTMRALIAALRHKGAAAVTVLIGSPPIAHPCRAGIDFKTYAELLAAIHRGDNAAMCAFLGADALFYLSMGSLRAELAKSPGGADNFCLACWNGEYAL